MTIKKQHILYILSIFITLIVVFIINIRYGSANITLNDFLDFIRFKLPKESTVHQILWQIRIPSALAAILVGACLSVSGLLMQTLFNNPLAGPYVLGISSGASIGVAILLMSGPLLSLPVLLIESPWSLTLAAALGSLMVLLIIIGVIKKLKNTFSILIIGLMLSSFTGAIITLLSYFSSAENLQKFTFWSMGNINLIQWDALLVLSSISLICFIVITFLIKPLNALLLGENYARSLGVSFEKVRLVILIITGVLTGSVTALAGPVAFIGLAVPQMTKLLFKTSDHLVLIVSSSLLGATILLICDLISELPGFNSTLPLNAMTSLFGAPIVIFLLLKPLKND